MIDTPNDMPSDMQSDISRLKNVWWSDVKYILPFLQYASAKIKSVLSYQLFVWKNAMHSRLSKVHFQVLIESEHKVIKILQMTFIFYHSVYNNTYVALFEEIIINNFSIQHFLWMTLFLVWEKLPGPNS